MKCLNCNGKMMPYEGKYIVEQNNHSIIIDNVPCLLCDTCKYCKFTENVETILEEYCLQLTNNEDIHILFNDINSKS